MQTLNRKLIRELRHTRGQSLAIAAVVASGVAVFVMALGTLGTLRSSRDAYYERYRFADVFASLRRAPTAILPRIATLPGVARVQTRIVSDVTLDVPELDEPAVGRLISLPEVGEPVLNAVYLRRGRLPEPGRASEVLASEAFVEANTLDVGDTLQAVMNGRLQELRIVGVAISPEYIFQLRGGDLLPDDRRFGVFWVSQRQMEAAFDMEGAFNDVSLRLAGGARSEPVIEALDRLLKPYGSIGAIDREDHVSARFVADEIKQLRATAVVAPSIFLGVATFLLNVVLSRQIGTQREIIATLKAFGYSDAAVAWHYLKSAILVALFGAVLGAAGGLYLGRGLARLYAEFYHFPSLISRIDWRIVLAGVSLSVLAAVAGSYRAIYQVMRLMPAEAMRPAAPARYRQSWLERLGLTPWIPLTARMVLRGLQRRPLNSLLSSLGISAAVAVLLVGNFAPDALDYLLEFQFERAQRHDVQVAFYEVASPSAAYDLRHLPGVQTAETFRAVPVKLRFRHRSYRTSIMGLGQRRDLYRLLDVDGRAIPLPPAGLVLSDKLAELLAVREGETVTVEVLEGEEPVREVVVSGLAVEYAGTTAYMDRQALHRLMGEADTLNGAFLAVDPGQLETLYRELKETPQIASVAVKSATVEQFRETVAKNQLTMQSFMVFFAAVIAIGVVYNTARISLEERSRELATMRVIGFTRSEVSAILLGELAVLTSLAIPLGWAIGYGLCYAMVRGFETEMFRIPLVIHPESFAFAALVTVLAAAASGFWIHRQIGQLDLVAVLKSSE
ncbi:ABC transporter permease [Candidatus Laterigemmans baculatus]|uniref:ABC transporter permease n=1 Tax=Candidatus Laterigemmans baculatus TaxID=2770505 RepID=UPI0013D96D5F|nr:ABC transporter permease [Candidatus Laterigemmans baculatus]